MSRILTEQSSFDSDIPTPVAGDTNYAATIDESLQKLANRTQWLKDNPSVGPQGPSGEMGTPGISGADGHTPVIEWVGDQLSIDGVVSGPNLTGPAGDTGPAGAQGATGATGAAGPAPTSDNITYVEYNALASALVESSLGASSISTITLDTDLSFSTTILSSLNASGKQKVIKFLQDGAGNHTVSFPASVRWASGVAPTITTTAGRSDIVTIIRIGTAYHASIIPDFDG